MSRSSVSVDEDRILFIRADDSEVAIAWSRLDAVSIQTTDTGPFQDDLFWLLESGGERHRIPSETPGVDDLMRAVQKLPGFDNEAIIDASTSLEPRVFECWRRNG
ncbi:MAG: hypothetical protein RLT05_24330 [Bauldia litoralis]